MIGGAAIGIAFIEVGAIIVWPCAVHVSCGGGGGLFSPRFLRECVLLWDVHTLLQYCSRSLFQSCKFGNCDEVRIICEDNRAYTRALKVPLGRSQGQSGIRVTILKFNFEMPSNTSKFNGYKKIIGLYPSFF